MKKHYSGKVILIAGASSGIGAALAREFFENGASVALLARREERIQALARELSPEEGRGARCLPIRCDLTNEEETLLAIELVRSKFGRIDGVVANAGFAVLGGIERLRLEDFRRQFETNVFALLRVILATLPDLKASRGRIVLTGSVAGPLPCPMGSPYGMSKRALDALADAMALELVPSGVSVTHVLPGYVESEIFQVDNSGQLHDRRIKPAPGGPLIMSSEKAARLIVHAAWKRRRQVILSSYGSILIGFYRIFPGLFHWVAARPPVLRLLLKERG